MQHFVDFYRKHWGDAEKPWLLLGKGPSFAKRFQFDLTDFNLISLNHAVRELPVLVAHVIDIDVIEMCWEAIESNARYLAVPWVPHCGENTSRVNLSTWMERIPTLRKLDEEGRLLWYDLSDADE